jgi:hypothetical protein
MFHFRQMALGHPATLPAIAALRHFWNPGFAAAGASEQPDGLTL